ncbi:MAG: hypothetical protein OHK93_003727 [Ramalina farinacea]|uniref:Uncharacterized protein n=1 Tax=Ramalina farinacea TaxID=258253 RepID=A0AA43TYC7_9LECA|nr:hypothetical protein [Ramalina farinacea]
MLLVQADGPYPLGIGLGPRFIAAARFTKAEEPMAIVRIPGSARYKAYIDDSIACEGKRIQYQGEWFVGDSGNLVPAPPDTHIMSSATSIFTEALLAIKKAAADTLGDSTLTIGGISYLDFFNSSSRQAVMEAAKNVEPTWRQPYQAMNPFQASRMAYKLDSCDGFGFDPRTCHMDEEDGYLVLLIEYEPCHLQFHLLDVLTEGVGVIKSARHRDLGADQHSDPRDMHFEPTQTALRKFMLDNEIGHEQAWAQYLGAVVISGQASPESFDRFLRPLVRNTMEQEGREALVKDSIDPAYVPAVGAAYRAMVWEKQPEMLDPMSWETAPPLYGHEGHDEL